MTAKPQDETVKAIEALGRITNALTDDQATALLRMDMVMEETDLSPSARAERFAAALLMVKPRPQ